MDELDLLNANEEIKVPFDELQKGTLYPIAQIERTSSMIEGKVVPGMKVKINHEGMSLFTYLPNKLVKLSDNLMDLINKAGETDNPFNVVFYGKIGRQGIGRIHKPGEGMLHIQIVCSFLCVRMIDF